MKKKGLLFVTVFMLLAAIAGLAACGNEDVVPGGETDIYGIYYLYDDGYVKDNYFRLNEDGTYERQSGTYVWKGTYSADGNKIVVSYEEEGEKRSIAGIIADGVLTFNIDGTDFSYYTEGKKPSGDNPGGDPPLPTEYDGMSYLLSDNGTYTLTSGKAGEVVIPREINGIPVTRIAAKAFLSAATTSLMIPDSVTVVEQTTFGDSLRFLYCEAESRPQGWDEAWNLLPSGSAVPAYWGVTDNTLTELDGAKYVKEEGNAVLSEYAGTSESLAVPASVDFGGMPHRVIAVGANAFLGNQNLVGVSLPDTLLEIRDGAFAMCANLARVTVGNGVNTIGLAAFSGCELNSVTFVHRSHWFTQNAQQPTEVKLVNGDALENPEQAAKLLRDSTETHFWKNTGEYDVRFMAGETLVSVVTAFEQENIELPDIPERTGYTAVWPKFEFPRDVTVYAVYTANEYTATFVADGVTVVTKSFTVETQGGSWFPTVPEKAGYIGKWDYEKLPARDVTVKAVYSTIPYTVTFVADGVTVGKDTYNVEDKTVESPAVPDKTGYSGSWESYSLTMGDVTVNAVYTPITYTVTFIADGVTVGTDTYTVENKTITEPAVPDKPGYSGAWQSYSLTIGNRTVNAVYTAIPYTVSFVADGITVATDTYTVEDKTITEPAVPDKTGYSGAWESYSLNTGNLTVSAVYTLIEYTVTFVADGVTVGSDIYTVEDKVITEPAVPDKADYSGAWETYTLITGNLTVNAVYTPITYTVTFVADGVIVGTETYTVENREITAPAVPEKADYTGVWESYSLTSGDFSVNAVYTPITYTVTFVADGVTVGSDTYTVEDRAITEPAVPDKTGYSGVWEDYTLIPGNLTVNAVYTLVTYTVTFVADGVNVGSDTYTVLDTAVTEPAVPDKTGYSGVWEDYTLIPGNQTINAVYTLVTYTVTFVADGVRVGSDTYTVENKTITQPAVPDKTGYSGVWESYTLTAGNLTVNAVYTAIPYTVTFVADGVRVGSDTYTVEDKTIAEPAVPDKAGYTGAWESYALTLGDLTVNAAYSLVTYTVTFVSDGMTVATDTYTVEDKTIVEPAVPNKTGYTGAWETYTLTTGNLTVHARYAAIEYTVTFVADGIIVGTDTYTVEDRTIIAPPIPNRVGYFANWEDYTLTTGDVTVNARYDPIPYFITFVAEGVTVETVFYTVGTQSVTEPAVPDKTGYTGAWESYTLTMGDITVNAVYTTITYTVTFVAGSVTVGTDTYTVEDTAITEPAVPHKNGYTAAWESYTLTTGNLTVNAVYTAVAFRVTFVADGVTVGSDTYTVEDATVTEPAVPEKIGYVGFWESYLLTYGNRIVNAVYTLIEYTVAFVADGVTVGTDTYTVEDKTIAVPAVPEKAGYTGVWESYTLTTGDLTVNAVYSLITYTITFVADGVAVGTDTYTVVDKSVTVPAVPNKTGYTGVWESYTLTTGNLTVNAVYTLIEYTVTFVADGFTVSTDTYTVVDRTITVPAVPEKAGYTGIWESYTLTTGDLTVNAIYTLIEYTITFVADGVTVGTDTYTVEDKTITVPAVPEKAGYTGVWESYTLTTGDLTVNAIYTLIEYTVTFVADGVTVGTDTYTVEDRTVTSPAVPEKADCTGEWETYTLTTGNLTVHALYTTKNATEGLVYSLSNNEYSVRGYNGADAHVIIPGIYRNLPVTSILTYAFGANNELASVTISKGVISIGDSAFRNCGGLTSVTIPDTVTSIGYYVFFGCASLTDITIPDSVISIGESAFRDCSALKNVTLGNGVPAIKDLVFEGCSGLTSINIPNSVTAIGNYAFSGCSALESITIPDSVTSIDSYAFNECRGLKNVTLGSGLTSIGESLFYICSSLACISVSADNQNYGSQDGILYNKAKTEFICIPDQLRGEIAIPDSITSIAERAFYGRSGITSITLPFVGAQKDGTLNTHFGYIFGAPSYSGQSDYIPTALKTVVITGGTSIPSYAFSGCGGLTGITLPDSVNAIGNSAFSGCIGLTSFTFPSGVTSISSSTFFGCNGFTTFTIPNGITSIGSSAFEYCKDLTSITIPESVTTISGAAFRHCVSLKNIQIPNSVTSIGESTFESSGLTSIIIPDSVTDISNAFYNCNGLTSITLPFVGAQKDGTVNTHFGYIFGAPSYSGQFSYIKSALKTVVITGGTNISSYAFYGCGGLTSITIPNGVTVIGSSAFYNCNGLTSITIPNTVSAIGDSAFRNCSGLTSIPIPDSVTSIGSSAFYGCNGLSNIAIPNGVTAIENFAFYGCSGLTSIAIPDSVTSIGSGAFYGCNGLSNIAIPNGVTSIDSSAFYGCSGLTSITIPNTVTAIGSSAFYDCSGLTSIVIPNGVTAIGKSAFENCDGLISITLPFIGAEKDGTVNTHFSYIFGASNYSNFDGYIPVTLKKVTVTGGTSIPIHAFRGCYGLKSVTIPESVTSIAPNAFTGCRGLTSLIIPAGVTEIGDRAFNNCTELLEIYNLSALNITAGSPDFGNVGYNAKNVYTRENGTWFTNTADGYRFFYDGTQGYLTGYVGRDAELVLPAGFTAYDGTQISNYSITAYSFYGCKDLTSITIPDSVTSIGESAFEHCSGLTSIEIPDSVTSIGKSAFSNCSSVTYVAIPNSLTSINDYLFSRCTSLTAITIPDSVTSIGYGAFRACSGLTAVTIGNGVTSIGNYVFERCGELTDITIGSGLADINGSIFIDCGKLAKISVDSRNAVYHSVENCLIKTADKELIVGCKNSVIPTDGSVTKIGSLAFYARYEGTSIEFPAGLTSIGFRSFYGCAQLTNIHIPDSVTEINEAFPDTAWYDNQADGEVYAGKVFYKYKGTMPENTSVAIKDGTLGIAGYAFQNCGNLVSITIPDSVIVIGESAFQFCSGLTSVTIPNSVTVIGDSAFYGCSGLTSVIIPDSVTSIGSFAFSDCSGLTSVTIPNSVTSIGNSAFSDCSGLTSVIIPDSVTVMETSAFSGCTSLTDIWCESAFFPSGWHGSWQGDSTVHWGGTWEYVNGVPTPKAA